MKQSDLISQLASSLNRRDEVPNQILAKKIVDSNDTDAIKELIQLLQTGSAKVKKDCIKVAYEIGEKKPALISNYTSVFVQLLKSKDNRMQWGAMTAIDCVTTEKSEEVFSNLPEIITAVENGSVITKDHGIEILVKLCSNEKYRSDVLPILIEFLTTSAVNQFPKYAERIESVVTADYRDSFLNVLNLRMDEFEVGAKRKRLMRLIKKLS